eukprot:m.213303 g.213303  ORF g.213303 m.213303 type:complete len:66 (+) comp18603_c2_seq3:3005-3202(+)
MADIQACTIEEELKQKLRKFRFRKEKTNAAIISVYLITALTAALITVGLDIQTQSTSTPCAFLPC